MEKFFKNDEYGITTLVRPLTRDDFEVDREVTPSKTKGNNKGRHRWGSYVSVQQVFRLKTPMDWKEAKEFKGLLASYTHSNEKEPIRVAVHVSKDVSMQGVRAEKQDEKLDAELAKLQKDFDGEKLFAEKIAEINKKTADYLTEDTNYNLSRASQHLRNPNSYKWEDNAARVALFKELKAINLKKKVILDNIDAIEITEIKKHIEENVPEPVKSAALKELEEKGLYDSSPFGRHL